MNTYLNINAIPDASIPIEKLSGPLNNNDIYVWNTTINPDGQIYPIDESEYNAIKNADVIVISLGNNTYYTNAKFIDTNNFITLTFTLHSESGDYIIVKILTIIVRSDYGYSATLSNLHYLPTLDKITAWDNKQDIISDLDTIRTNAANYKGTVTSVKIDNVSKSPSSGVIDLGYINKQLSTSTSSSMTLSPNIYYRNTNTNLSTLTISLGSVSNSNILNEYLVEFTTRSSGTTVTLPSSIKWVNGTAPTLENGKTYQISIVNNLGTCVKFG